MTLGAREHVHAVGAFALYYNDLELTLNRLFQLYVPLGDGPRTFLFFSLNNRARVDFINRLAADDRDPAKAEAVMFATRCFDIVCENRNLLLHGVPYRTNSETLSILKAASGSKDGMFKSYQFTLAQIQGAARAAAVTSDYIMSLCEAIDDQNTANALLPPELRPTLPDRPLQPSKLTPPPPPKEKQGGKRQPQSRRAKAGEGPPQ